MHTRDTDDLGHDHSGGMGFTAVLCGGRGCCAAPVFAATRSALRAAVRVCPHGVLVSSGCPLATASCQAVHHTGQGVPAGPVVVVVPCSPDARRTPLGRPRWVGPIRTSEQAAQVAAWLRAPGLPLAELPAELRLGQRLAVAAANN